MKKFTINTFYFLLIICITIFVSSFALVRKATRYQSIQNPIIIEVNKEKVVVMNQIVGSIKSLDIEEGQYVTKGDLIGTIDDENILSRITTLQAQTKNLSAQTEAEVLVKQLPLYEIRAPRDGIVYTVHTSTGSYLNGLNPIATLYANDNTKLTAFVSEIQYSELKNEPMIQAFSKRFEQSYPIQIKGIGKVTTDPNSKQPLYELKLSFNNPQEGIAFLEGESLELLHKKPTPIAQKPTEDVVSLFQWLGL